MPSEIQIYKLLKLKDQERNDAWDGHLDNFNDFVTETCWGSVWPVVKRSVPICRFSAGGQSMIFDGLIDEFKIVFHNYI